MSGGRTRRRGFLGANVSPCGHKGALLTADERATALRLKGQRFNATAIARAIGRSVRAVEDFLNSPEAKL